MKKRLKSRKEAGTWKETSRIRNEQMLAHSKDAARIIGSIEPLHAREPLANNELR